MSTNLTFDSSSPFRIKRPLITTNGFVSAVDATVKSHLDELNGLLGKRIFPIEKGPHRAAEAKKEGDLAAGATEMSKVLAHIKEQLARSLTAKRTSANKWAENSLLREFDEALENPKKLTLADYIDLTADLSALKYDFQGNLSANWFNLDYNAKTVLDGYSAITDYLIAYGFIVMGLKEVNGLKNFILSNRLGAKNVEDYAIVSAARTIIDREKLIVADFNVDTSEIVTRLKSAGLSLSSASFYTTAKAVINDDIFNSNESKLIDDANIGTLPPGIKPLLIKYIKRSSVPITKDNVQFFLPLFISQIQGATDISDPTQVDTTESDKDFDVEFLQDDDSLIQVNVSAVKCASQLYYDMVLGDELRVLQIAQYFTNKYLIRGGINIEDSQLRQDLQLYVFSNRFTDLKTNKVVDRTRPGERQMFYRQVFDYGDGQVSEDVIVNTEFAKLWKVLILESAKYLERAQAAFNPDSYVSRNNVMQAVEDLQYNLSTHCTGMANVITPIIYAELNFVIKRIFMHPEILKQVVPVGGTWWRVVETLYMSMQNTRPKATVLYNKAKLGHDIILSISDYNPATFEDDATFSAFISNVDAFITTQSILQDALTDDLKKAQEDPDSKTSPPARAVAPPPNMPAPAGGKTGSDEWDF